MTYEVNGDKGKVKTAAGKQVSCTVVRVAIASGPKSADTEPSYRYGVQSDDAKQGLSFGDYSSRERIWEKKDENDELA
jgi:hypothetical protein